MLPVNLVAVEFPRLTDRSSVQEDRLDALERRQAWGEAPSVAVVPGSPTQRDNPSWGISDMDVVAVSAGMGPVGGGQLSLGPALLVEVVVIGDDPIEEGQVQCVGASAAGIRVAFLRFARPVCVFSPLRAAKPSRGNNIKRSGRVGGVDPFARFIIGKVVHESLPPASPLIHNSGWLG